ncbi:hypothetical protein Trydic_g2363 [Trypoxylus dichotomus]
MRVAFLILPIFICAGLALASRDHDGRNRHEVHDKNKRHHQNRGVDVVDESDADNSSEPSLSEVLDKVAEEIEKIEDDDNVIDLLTRSKSIPVPADSDKVENLDDSNLLRIIPRRSERRKYSRHEKYGQPGSKKAT